MMRRCWTLPHDRQGMRKAWNASRNWLYYKARYRADQTARDRTGLVYGRQARISLVTVEREVRVYSLVVSDPMFRFPATSLSAPSSPVSPPPSSLPVSPAPVTGWPEVYWRVELEHWSTQHWLETSAVEARKSGRTVMGTSLTVRSEMETYWTWSDLLTGWLVDWMVMV